MTENVYQRLTGKAIFDRAQHILVSIKATSNLKFVLKINDLNL